MNKREISFIVMLIIIIALIGLIVWIAVDKKHNTIDKTTESIVSPVVSEQQNLFDKLKQNEYDAMNETNQSTANNITNIISQNTVGNTVNTISQNTVIENNKNENSQIDETDLPKLNVKIGNRIFTAVMYENDAAREFIERLPLTITMSELNGNEKYSYLSRNFTTSDEKVGAIQSGDIMVYGGNCLVLFYKDFDTIYQYTRIARIQNPINIDKLVGNGKIELTFSIKTDN